MDFSSILAQRTKHMGASAIREILKVVAQPGMVSLAGGIPAPESFPLELISELTAQVIADYGAQALQYDMTEGFLPLREALVPYLYERYRIVASADGICTASGSQGVLDAVAKVLISPGDKIAVEAPTYLGAIQAFTPYEPEYIRMDTDEQGLLPESLDQTLHTHRIKFVYLVPTFQNPTGRTIPLERRQHIARIIQHYDVLALEDDPYSALRYRGSEVVPIKTLAPEHVLYISTFSKVFAPGLRIGFYVAPPALQKWLIIVKQGVDLHTSTFNQALVSAYLSNGYLQQHLPKILQIYAPRQEAMLRALDRYFPQDFLWSRPEGGMFIWVEGPQGMNMEPIYWKAIEKNVAFVPGHFFYTHQGEGLETMRLNFTTTDEATIDRAIKQLAEVIHAARPQRVGR